MSPTLRHELVNAVIAATGAKSFLQFGSARFFDEVECPVKKSAHFEAADQIPPGKLYDVVFVDPPQDASRARFAIQVALEHASPTGVVMVANCNPTAEWMQEVPASAGVQLGQAWKAWVGLRPTVGCASVVADMDHGVGVLARMCPPRATFQDWPESAMLDYAYLDQNRARLLGLLPVLDVLALLAGVESEPTSPAAELAPTPTDPPAPRRRRRDR